MEKIKKFTGKKFSEVFIRIPGTHKKHYVIQAHQQVFEIIAQNYLVSVLT